MQALDEIYKIFAFLHFCFQNLTYLVICNCCQKSTDVTQLMNMFLNFNDFTLKSKYPMIDARESRADSQSHVQNP